MSSAVLAPVHKLADDDLPPPATRTLYAFDFDLTLVNTVESSKWEEVHGAPWDGMGWFAHEDSLFTHTRGPAMDAYFEAVKNPNGVILLHTGRQLKMQTKALEVLAGYGAVRFEEVGFCTKRRKALKQKVSRIALLIDKYDIDRVVMYDDKATNVAKFRSMPVKKGVTVEVNDVGVKPMMEATEPETR